MNSPIGFADCNSILTELQELRHWELSDQSIADWLTLYSNASAKIKDINMEFDLMRVKGINSDTKSDEEIQFYKETFPKFKELDVLLTKIP